MDMLDKFRRGAQKASIQATAFVKDSSSKVASGSRDFVQGFSLPSEADKAAKILDSFLGVLMLTYLSAHWMTNERFIHNKPIQNTPNPL